MNREHKYKDKNKYKDKDAERITESLTVCYIFRILMTQAFQVWWQIPPPGQPPQPPRPLAKSQTHLTSKKNHLEMIWNDEKIGQITFCQGSRFNLADHSGTICSCFSFCSIWDQAQLYVSLIETLLFKKCYAKLHTFSWKWLFLKSNRRSI